MKQGDFVELIADKEFYATKGIEKGAHGFVVRDDAGGFSVLFFNEKNVGDYAILSAEKQDFQATGEALPEYLLVEMEKKIGTLSDRTEFEPVRYKEYDEIEITVEKEKYSRYGVHKGMRGVIMESYAIKNRWYVIFTDNKTGCDIADICVDEDDMRAVEENE